MKQNDSDLILCGNTHTIVIARIKWGFITSLAFVLMFFSTTVAIAEDEDDDPEPAPFEIAAAELGLDLTSSDLLDHSQFENPYEGTFCQEGLEDPALDD